MSSVPSRIRTFAYGSNMLTARIRERAPSAKAIGIGCLRAHALKWHKRSQDGSSKCDIESTGREQDAVWGVIFELDAADKPGLDRAEGVGLGYVERQVDVAMESGVVKAITYIATARDPALKPYHWYKAMVLAGAREHKLAPEYIRALEDVPSRRDLNEARAARNEKLLAAG